MDRNAIAVVRHDEVAQRQVRDDAVAVDTDVSRRRVSGTSNPQVVDRHVTGSDVHGRARRRGDNRVHGRIAPATGADNRQPLIDRHVLAVGPRRYVDRVAGCGYIHATLDARRWTGWAGDAVRGNENVVCLDTYETWYVYCIIRTVTNFVFRIKQLSNCHRAAKFPIEGCACCRDRQGCWSEWGRFETAQPNISRWRVCRWLYKSSIANVQSSTDADQR